MQTVHPISYVQHSCLVRIIWNSLREFQWVDHQQLGMTQLQQRLLHICVYLSTSQKIHFMHVKKKRTEKKKSENTMGYWFESRRKVKGTSACSLGKTRGHIHNSLAPQVSVPKPRFRRWGPTVTPWPRIPVIRTRSHSYKNSTDIITAIVSI